AGGVTVAGALKLAAQGAFKPSDEVVLCITGNGLKTVEAITDPAYGPPPEAPVVEPKLREVRALVEART
ncbi:MAG: threonine synthase, partial [Gemmatimonadota bacterium]|nr:threonine synthase [Gemmatimonadota bacterium]